VEQPLVFTKLEVQNVLRIKLVRVRPDGSVFVVGGANDQGKTSLIDSIAMLLGGADAIPKVPLRKGQKRGHIIGRLGGPDGHELEIERTFTEKGSALVVRNADGQEVKSPQKLLATLYSAISFDPLEFSKAKPQARGELARKAMNLDFAEVDAARAQAHTDRHGANRRVRDLEGELRALPEFDEKAPKQEQSASDLARMLADGRSYGTRLQLLEEAVEQKKQATTAAAARVERAKQELAAADAALLEAGSVYQRSMVDLTEARMGAPNLEELEAGLRDVEAVNERVRRNKARLAKETELDKAREEAQQCDDAIQRYDANKAKAIAEAKFPVPGVSFSADGLVLLDELPFEQAAHSKQIRLSAAIGFALNPRLRVLLIREGSDLDSKARALLSEIATERGGQVWLEVVSETGEGCSVVLEDGEVKP
jgi:DNA repair exonuclease SbcCD ATPase subunit